MDVALFPPLYPYLAGPLMAVDALIGRIGEFNPLGSPYISVEFVRDVGLPVLVALPVGIAVLLGLGARWVVGSRPSREHPLETLQTHESPSTPDPLLDVQVAGGPYVREPEPIAQSDGGPE